MQEAENIRELWKLIYPEDDEKLLNEFILFLNSKVDNQQINDKIDKLWYKDAVVYSLYVDRFNTDFSGLSDKLDYLRELGITCLWLLPILESPMRDAGFDISNFYNIHPELCGSNSENSIECFTEFLQKAHTLGMKVIFDVALNHTSDQHQWFVNATKSIDSRYRDFYIWNNGEHLYKEARIIFKGIEKSNWQKHGEQYYFHRFFSFQPDLNYKNPEVLIEMCKVLIFWQSIGVDGFRADAIPYLWKEDGTNCENLSQTHLIVKFFRSALDFIKKGTLLLAEACQQPKQVVEYLGNSDECHAAYHFPLMPRIFKAIEMKDRNPIIETLSDSFTPKIPDKCQWFTFLRCHDELSLELVYVTEEEREFLHNAYCRKPLWDFRNGEGISARLADLMQLDPNKILLAYSLILTLTGTPIIYYGDEVATRNDEILYEKSVKETGKDDSRFLIRNFLDWKLIDNQLEEVDTVAYKVFHGLKNMLAVREKFKAFGRGNLVFKNKLSEHKSILCFEKSYKSERILVIHNFADFPVEIDFTINKKVDLFGNSLNKTIEPCGFRWFDMS